MFLSVSNWLPRAPEKTLGLTSDQKVAGSSPAGCAIDIQRLTTNIIFRVFCLYRFCACFWALSRLPGRNQAFVGRQRCSWREGPQFTNNGFFHIAFVLNGQEVNPGSAPANQGRWWLVAPSGRLFWRLFGLGYPGSVALPHTRATFQPRRVLILSSSPYGPPPLQVVRSLLRPRITASIQD